MSTTAFRAIIAAIGAANVFLGLNVGLGGLRTLGWQGAGVFYQVTDEHLYLIRDSHMRFYGGLYVAVGLFLILATTDLRRYRPALNLVFAMIFAGGLARLSAMRPDVVLGADLVVSLAVELVLMPVLFAWLSRMLRVTDASGAPSPPAAGRAARSAPG
jgi:Domain of unknown function (DUF4345)